ncbi:solute carrier family 22 member 13-like [Physella acuta]|uniref:solute carrier family 22 member 13-like n=1 Tax=Physella acuta TaxID=109671 RepID=UPI0027DE0267|nr:solute carrier family 22 member 13-like [Physella acuta]
MSNDVTSTSHWQCSTTFYFSDGRNETVLCTAGQWMYTPVHNEWNIVSQFDLVCSDAYLVDLATTIYFSGVTIGSLVFGDLADRYGRLPVMLFTLYTSSVLGVIIAFSVNYTMFVVLRFLQGLLMQIPVPDEEWELVKKETNTSMDGQVRQCNLTDLVRNGQMRQRSLILFYVCLHDNVYLLFCIGGVFETSVYLLNLPMMNRFGRKKPLMATMIVAGVAFIATGFLNDFLSDNSYVKVAMAMVALCAACSQYAMIFVYTSEIYPTVMR